MSLNLGSRGCSAGAAILLLSALLGTSAGRAVAAPAVGLSEHTVHFSNQAVGTTSSARTLVVTNEGPGTLEIAGASIIGADPADFAVISGGGAATVPEHETHTISVTFHPTAAGDRSAQLQINDNGTGSPQIVALTGTGTESTDSHTPASTEPLVILTPAVTGPIVSLNPTSLNFPLRPVGSTSPVQTLVLKNTGNAPLHIINVTFGGPIQTDFHFTGGDSAGTLNPGESRNITLIFSPTTAGLRTTRVDVITDAATNPDRVPVQGIGVATGGPTFPAIPTNVALFASAIDGVPTSGHPDQVFISVGQCLTLTMLVKFRTGDFIDVTSDPNTRFFTDPARDGFNVLNHSNTFCATDADANRTFTIYGHAFSQSDHQGITDTLIVHVRRSDRRR